MTNESGGRWNNKIVYWEFGGKGKVGEYKLESEPESRPCTI
jgi:hypothetical protein